MAEREYMTSEFGLRKIVFQEKKSSSCNSVKIATIIVLRTIIFKKKFFKQLLTKKCEKVPIESIDLQKKYIV